MSRYSASLSKYMPKQAAPIISQWIDDYSCQFRVSRRRTSKLGDYRAPYGKHGHRISVNGDLNPYACLSTTVHEFAHLKTWNTYGNRVKPHGTEWKTNFQRLIQPFLHTSIFPDDILTALTTYMTNPAAASCTDVELFKRLSAYDTASGNDYSIAQLPYDAVFATHNGRIFQKKEQLRKRYRCVELKTQRIYLFQPIAQVQPLNVPLARHNTGEPTPGPDAPAQKKRGWKDKLKTIL